MLKRLHFSQNKVAEKYWLLKKATFLIQILYESEEKYQHEKSSKLQRKTLEGAKVL